MVAADKLSKVGMAKPYDALAVIDKEYATRLLESMGATPTKANLEMVRKYVPINKECLKVSARKTGHSKDQVEIVAPTIKVGERGLKRPAPLFDGFPSGSIYICPLESVLESARVYAHRSKADKTILLERTRDISALKRSTQQRMP
eukprot:941125-Pyramimonas_sp.AAC.1